jgi:hypothetical protein
MRKTLSIITLGLLLALPALFAVTIPASAFAGGADHSGWNAPHRPTKLEWLIVDLNVNHSRDCMILGLNVHVMSGSPGAVDIFIGGDRKELEKGYRDCAEQILGSIQFAAGAMKLPPPPLWLSVSLQGDQQRPSLRLFRCEVPPLPSRRPVPAAPNPKMSEVCQEQKPEAK